MQPRQNDHSSSNSDYDESSNDDELDFYYRRADGSVKFCLGGIRGETKRPNNS